MIVLEINNSKWARNYRPFVHRWQARREGDRNMRAGLIPSRALQERRILLERQQKEKQDEDNISTWISTFAYVASNNSFGLGL
jgi:hypothetical protein